MEVKKTFLEKQLKLKIANKIRTAASTIEGKIHVIPKDSRWGVKKEGSSRLASIHSSKPEALVAARKLITRIDSSSLIIIHNQDGRIAAIDYGV